MALGVGMVAHFLPLQWKPRIQEIKQKPAYSIQKHPADLRVSPQGIHTLVWLLVSRICLQLRSRTAGGSTRVSRCTVTRASPFKMATGTPGFSPPGGVMRSSMTSSRRPSLALMSARPGPTVLKTDWNTGDMAYSLSMASSYLFLFFHGVPVCLIFVQFLCFLFLVKFVFHFFLKPCVSGLWSICPGSWLSKLSVTDLKFWFGAPWESEVYPELLRKISGIGSPAACVIFQAENRAT